MPAQRCTHYTMREPGWPDCGAQNLTLTLALRMVRRYGQNVPTIARLVTDFNVSRATAYRYRAAFVDSLEQQERR
ncbi:hypothetical protein AB8810_11005 [Xanthomonas sp. NCPPB 3005]|uniref:hypothetical protein n=1 Tax=Xanthomonas sp. NCPPB 3005 TaxID=3240913 RepID=UPI003512B67C